MDEFLHVKRHLTRFEALAQRLVEGSFGRLFGGQLQALDLAAHLARSMEDNQFNGLAPDRYLIHLHPQAYTAVTAQNPRLIPDLITYLEQLAQQSSLVFAVTPEVQFITDANLPRHAISVQAEHGQVRNESTQVYEQVAPENEATAQVRALDAFLILDGRRHVSLHKPIITLGRRADNDIVLESPAVSRRHAQLRWRYGRFVLYDLSGQGRTAVNNEPISECVLQPGDVIRLSDTFLIYGEGQDNSSAHRANHDGDTQLFLPATQQP